MPEPCTFAAIAAAASVAGVGLAAKGAHDQKKAQRKALDQEQANFEAQQKENWKRYMLSRGVDQSTGRAVNTKLPLWATVTRRGNAP